uniref:C-type lectin domain-containing protein n=1 Tax=Neogobius melanostomus TaxID=47308 RepID=A0A8C6SKD5_9GOBI
MSVLIESFNHFLFILFLFCTGSTEPGSKNYSLVLTSMSWEDARSHCKQHFTDLAMIEDESENTAVASIISSYTVWIGLYRQPWRWTDGSASSFTNWYPGRPNNCASVQHCVYENNNHEWNDYSCSYAARFICHRGKGNVCMYK